MNTGYDKYLYQCDLFNASGLLFEVFLSVSSSALLELVATLNEAKNSKTCSQVRDNIIY